jgi:hypothetical protein
MSRQTILIADRATDKPSQCRRWVPTSLAVYVVIPMVVSIAGSACLGGLPARAAQAQQADVGLVPPIMPIRADS